MKVSLFILALLIGATAGGGGAYFWMHGATGADGGEGKGEILYYRHPMDSSITSDTPDKGSMGMDYIPVYEGEEDEADVEGERTPGTVSIKSHVVQNLGVRTGKAEKGSLTPEIRALGRVTYDETAIEDVHVRAEGWVEALEVRARDERVERDQVLFRVYSPRLLNAQEEFLQAVRRGAGVVSVRERLQGLGMAEMDISTLAKSGRVQRLVPVRAPRDGIVRELNIAEGSFITPDQSLMRIVGFDQVWLMLEVFERDMDRVRMGQSITVHWPLRPDSAVEGEVAYIHPGLDDTDRTFRARVVLPNPDERLSPGMLGRVRLQGEAMEAVVHVPAEALIRTGDQDRLVVARDEGDYQVREVVAGARVGDRVVIRDGIEAGEPVVVSSQFLIDSESSDVAELERLSASESRNAPEVPDDD